MVCLFALLAAFAPRVAFVFYWIARPNMVAAAFNGWLIPILGLVFLPFATLFYTVLYTPGVGLTGWDWLWVILAVLLDIQHYASAYTKRNDIPGYGTTAA
ncbi:MAG: hypothetical protein HC802_15625 [Caldilineaceae bacterium]|nr:hypothetical protein [Caldilineaceae bacterium]